MATKLEYNPALPEARENPFLWYRQLRETDPVHYSEALDAWVLTRYDDVVAVLKDPRFSADRTTARSRLNQPAMMAPAAGARPRGNTMLTADPPEHTRLRLIVSRAFLPKAVEELRPHIQAITDELIDAVRDTGRMDIVHDLAYPLPVIVIAELMGVPTADRAQFRRWSDDVVATLGGQFADPEVLTRGAKSAQELQQYFRGIIADRRQKPKGDLVSVLVAARDEREALTEEQLVATCMVMLIAGNETTRNLIGNGMLALLQHPDQLDLLWREPSIAHTAVEELLRYAGPVQGTSRVATEDLVVGGEQIHKGDVVFTMLAAANRDPAHFHDPETLDLNRRNNHHVAFGFGIHACLGQPLARLEAEVAFASLARRIPHPRLSATHLEWGPSFILRGLKRLPIAFSSAAS